MVDVPEPFDPYQAWLGFEPGRGPADHYQLLGIATFESDPAVIGRAADGRLSTIRRVRPGEHLAAWQQVLDHLRSVKACLLDPAAKAAYDASLRNPPPDAATAAVADADDRMTVAPPARRRMKWPRLLVHGGWVAAACVAAAAALSFLGQNPAPAPPAPDHATGRTSTKLVEAAAAEPSPQINAPAEAPLAAVPAPREAAAGNPPQPSEPELPTPSADAGGPPSPAAPAADTPVDAAKQAAVIRQTAAAREAMAERDLTAARRHLAAAAAVAETAEDHRQLSGLETLAGHLEEFWKAVRQSAAGLHTGQELAIGGTTILVVEASADGVVLRAEGRNYAYPVDQLPHAVAVKLAETWLADVPSSKVLVAAHLMVDPKGDRAESRRLLDDAARAGLDVADLLAELDTAPPSAIGSPQNAPASPAPVTAAVKSDIPTDEARLQRAVAEVREIFRGEYGHAGTPAGKASLAAKLLEGAATIADDPAVRYVMLREARDLAIAAGEPALACDAVDQLSAAFDVDGLAMKASLLESLGQSVRGLDVQRQIAQTALELIPEAVKLRRIEEALTLAQTAEAAAVRAKSVPLVRAARAAVEQLQSAGR